MNKEQIALLYVIFGAVVMTVLGISFALLTDSDAILLDALFNLVTLIMSLLTLKVARLIKQGSSAKFQFGYYGFEPMLNMTKGSIILVLCLIAGVDSLLVILSGGKPLDTGLAAIYAITATIICFVTASILRHFRKQLHSPLVELESFNWLVNGVISAGIAVTFLFAYFIQSSKWNFIVPYIDPAIVILLVLLVIKIPFEIITDSFNQLLGAAPQPELEQQLKTELTTVLAEHNLKVFDTQMMLSGRLLYIKLQVRFTGSFGLTSDKMLDEIQSSIKVSAKKLHPDIQIDLVL
ncbi:cation transporter [Thalassomonas sp. RHCl1]|uniref:cation diffusion facilitator family transporter n=1 Tax=Thalassomonas sp. RHCl1 TaxID=2995320 RepID=UPI00248B6628|nr:cation transporter [Thalassomonas sp. RHCl1]